MGGNLESYYYCTGPIYCFISSDPIGKFLGGGSSSGAAIRFLGTCETYPEVQGGQAWMPVYTNKSGPLVPQDKLFAGQTRIISLDLNNYNATALADNTHPPDGERSEADNYGETLRLDRGSFLVADDCGFRLWLIFSFYRTINRDAFPNMVGGEFYPACSLAMDFQDRQGTQNKRHRLLIEAQEVRDKKTGKWVLYSTKDADLQNLHSRLPNENS